MKDQLEMTLIAAAVSGIGWVINYWFSSIRDERKRRIEVQLKFVERQIEELYGPLAACLYEGRQTFLELLKSLGRSSVFEANQELKADELKTWLFWVESEFLPRNEQISILLKTKAHLVDGPRFPNSYVNFFEHCSSWAIYHRRWMEQKVKYNWHASINWPDEFEKEALSTFQEIKARHASLLGKLA